MRPCKFPIGFILNPTSQNFTTESTEKEEHTEPTEIFICRLTKSTEGLHPDETVMTGLLGVFAGGAIILGHGIYDMCTTPSSVRKYNESLMEGNNLRLVPEADPFNETYGLSLVYGF